MYRIMQLAVLELFLEFIDRDYLYRSFITDRLSSAVRYRQTRTLITEHSFTDRVTLYLSIKERKNATRDGTTRRNVSFRLEIQSPFFYHYKSYLCISIRETNNANFSNRTIERKCIGPVIEDRISKILRIRYT